MANYSKKAAPGKRDIIAGIGLVAVVVLFIFFFLKEDKYADCASTVAEAGDMMRAEFPKRASDLTILFHNEETTEETDADALYAEILAEGFKNTGNPMEGDYMAISKGLAEGAEYYSFDQKDGTIILVYAVAGKFYTSKAEEEALKKKSDEILFGLDMDEKSDYEKVEAIYKYICENVETVTIQPGDKSLADYSAYGAVANGKAVSSGIAQLFYYLAVTGGLDCRIVVNDSSAWNFVNVDGNYYYINAAADTGKDASAWTGFLKGTDSFEEPSVSGIELPFGNTPLVDSDKDYTISSADYAK